MSKLKLTRRFWAICLLSTCQLAHGFWPFTNPQPTVRQQIVKTVKNYPVETALAIAPAFGVGYIAGRISQALAPNSSVGLREVKRRKPLRFVLPLGALATWVYVANKKGYVTTAKINSLATTGINKAASFIHKYKKPLLVVEALGVAALAAEALDAGKAIKTAYANWSKPRPKPQPKPKPAEIKLPQIDASIVTEQTIFTGIAHLICGNWTPEQAAALLPMGAPNRDVIKSMFEGISQAVALVSLPQGACTPWPGKDDPNRGAVVKRVEIVDGLLTKATGRAFRGLKAQ